jgi:hypothetical protein
VNATCDLRGGHKDVELAEMTPRQSTRGIGIFSPSATEKQVLSQNLWRSLAMGGNFIRLL